LGDMPKVKSLRGSGIERPRAGLVPASIGTPDAIIDSSLKCTCALFFKTTAGTLVALAGQFALLPGFVSGLLLVRQIFLGRRSVLILDVLKMGGERFQSRGRILRRCRMRRGQQQTCNNRRVPARFPFFDPIWRTAACSAAGRFSA